VTSLHHCPSWRISCGSRRKCCNRPGNHVLQQRRDRNDEPAHGGRWQRPAQRLTEVLAEQHTRASDAAREHHEVQQRVGGPASRRAHRARAHPTRLFARWRERRPSGAATVIAAARASVGRAGGSARECDPDSCAAGNPHADTEPAAAQAADRSRNATNDDVHVGSDVVHTPSIPRRRCT
jgi:hypothetical protein